MCEGGFSAFPRDDLGHLLPQRETNVIGDTLSGSLDHVSRRESVVDRDAAS